MMKSLVTIVAAVGLAAGASAQTAPPSGGLGGLAGLLGGGLPNIASVGAGNAAGLLGYCLKNNLLGAAQTATGTAATAGAAQPTGAQSILQRLTGRQGVATSPGYAAGQAGQVQTGAGQALSLDALRGQIKTRVCSAVLNRAKSFLQNGSPASPPLVSKQGRRTMPVVARPSMGSAAGLRDRGRRITR